MAAELVSKAPILDLNRDQAAARLAAYVQSPEEKVLMDHQVDVMGNLQEFFAGGETAGYISLPTGAGKTHIIAELAKTLGLKTVVLSPLVKILEQNGKKIREIAPDLEISDYYSDSKDANGQVINTTYASIQAMIQNGRINPNEIGLVISDEAHTALGQKRHKVFREFPNALMVGLTATPYFEPVEEYKRRGLIDESERWSGLFENMIAELSLEEAIERGILTHLDVNILRTGADVRGIRITSDGEYNDSDLSRYLNIESRNVLTVALLTGRIESNEISDQQRAEIERMHDKIKGKKTAIFGIDIAHVDDLAKKIEAAGLDVGVVHSNMSTDARRNVFEAYDKGEIQVLLGVDMLRLGWDSPDTEVGIYLAPTRSGIVAKQELGRILRTAPGKEQAIAIQMVDIFDRGLSPVLIPNLFDPYFVLRGTMRGEEYIKGITRDQQRPNLTFSGIGIETIIEQVRSQELLKQRIGRASLEELDEIVRNLAADVYQENPDAQPFEFYRALADELPSRVSSEVVLKSLQALASIDSNVSGMGKRIIPILYLRTILSSVEKYLDEDPEVNNEIIQAAILGVLEIFSGEKSHWKTRALSGMTLNASEIYGAAQAEACRQISEARNVPLSWVKSGKYKEIEKRINHFLVTPASPGGLEAKFDWKTTDTSIHDSEDLVEEFVDTLSKETGESKKSIGAYLKHRMALVSSVIDDSEFTDTLDQKELEKVVKRLIKNGFFSRKEKIALVNRFGLFGNEPLTLDQVGKIMSVTGPRASQYEARALRKLRHPSRSRYLEGYLDDGYLSGVSRFRYTPNYEDEALFRAEKIERLAQAREELALAATREALNRLRKGKETSAFVKKLEMADIGHLRRRRLIDRTFYRLVEGTKVPSTIYGLMYINKQEMDDLVESLRPIQGSQTLIFTDIGNNEVEDLAARIKDSLRDPNYHNISIEARSQYDSSAELVKRMKEISEADSIPVVITSLEKALELRIEIDRKGS